WTEIVFYIYNNLESSLLVEYEFTVDIAEGMEEEPESGRQTNLVFESNPMTSGQSLTVSLSEAGYASLNVYDLSGRMVGRIASGQFPQGETTLQWNADELAPGAYLLRLAAPGGGLTRKVVIQ
ncbi:T9SS type A sorting domain-containing protein, partial [Candidatus Fermentibacteria bacterium]|nr:T9SS type A sorting domain-containing protein [Candidatus Fermentibacteria bacterium]